MEEFNKGLEKAAEKHGVQVIVKKHKQQRASEEQEGPVVDYVMKRFFAAVGFLFFCLCVYKAAEHGALDNVMNVAMWGIVVVFGIGFVHGALSK